MFCPKCGKEPGAGGFICDSCGRVLKRPKVINVVAIIELIAGILSVFGGIIWLLANTMMKGMDLKEPPTSVGKAFIKHAPLFGYGIIVWGIISIVVWFGLRRLKKWAGVLGITECTASILICILLSFVREPVTIGLNLLIIILILTGWKSLR